MKDALGTQRHSRAETARGELVLADPVRARTEEAVAWRELRHAEAPSPPEQELHGSSKHTSTSFFPSLYPQAPQNPALKSSGRRAREMLPTAGSHLPGTRSWREGGQMPTPRRLARE